MKYSEYYKGYTCGVFDTDSGGETKSRIPISESQHLKRFYDILTIKATNYAKTDVTIVLLVENQVKSICHTTS